VIGGLMVATVATLFFVPAVFAASRGLGRREKSGNPAREAGKERPAEDALVFARGAEL
jgi:hypothetical protein